MTLFCVWGFSKDGYRKWCSCLWEFGVPRLGIVFRGRLRDLVSRFVRLGLVVGGGTRIPLQ